MATEKSSKIHDLGKFQMAFPNGDVIVIGPSNIPDCGHAIHLIQQGEIKLIVDDIEESKAAILTTALYKLFAELFSEEEETPSSDGE